MATEPTGTQFPTNYDDDSTLLGNLLDQRNFQLKTTVDLDDTTIEVEGSVADVDLPVYLKWGDSTSEITYADEVNEAKTAFTNVKRGARGTTGVGHTAGAGIYIPVTGMQFYLFADALIAAEKYQALVKTSSPGTCSPGEALIRSDEDKAYECYENNVWLHVGRTDHHELLNLNVDDHSNLHNDARAWSWHDPLSGGHVDGGDTHTHTTGTGPKKIYGGTSLPGTPTYEREYFYDETNNYLYISKNTSDWVKITGAPTNAIMMITEATAAYYGGACPPGWSRFTSLDERIPVGAPASKPPGLGNVGSDTHTHIYSTIVSHYHSVPSWSIDVVYYSTYHSHNYKQGTGGDCAVAANNSTRSSSILSSYSGDHTHTFTVPANNTNSTKRTSDNADGVTEGTTETGSSLFPYKTVIFCKKD